MDDDDASEERKKSERSRLVATEVAVGGLFIAVLDTQRSLAALMEAIASSGELNAAQKEHLDTARNLLAEADKKLTSDGDMFFEMHQ
jgi:hypothetical protein